MKTLIYGIGVVFLAAVLVAVIGLVAALPVMLLWNAVVLLIIVVLINGLSTWLARKIGKHGGNNG